MLLYRRRKKEDKKMEIKELQEKLQAKKRGQFLTITYKKVVGSYSKITTTTVRLIDYASAIGKKVVNKTENSQNKPSNDVHLGNNLIFNQNTGKTRLQVFLTKCKNHKPHSIYWKLDEDGVNEQITAEEFYNGTGEKRQEPTLMFCVLTDNIVKVK